MESHPLVAAFPTCLGAHDAAANLRESGFHDIWIGVTVAGTSIQSTLVRHGVILTVASDGYPEIAALVIEAAGGLVLCGDSFYSAAPPATKATVPTIAGEVDLSDVVRLSERRKAPRHFTPYKQVS